MPVVQIRAILALWALASSGIDGLQQSKNDDSNVKAPQQLEVNEKGSFQVIKPSSKSSPALIRRKQAILEVLSDGTQVAPMQDVRRPDEKVEPQVGVNAALEVTTQRRGHNGKRDVATTHVMGSTAILSLYQGVAIAVVIGVVFGIGVLVFITGRSAPSFDMRESLCCDSVTSLYKGQKAKCGMYQKCRLAMADSNNASPGTHTELPPRLLPFVKQDFTETNVGILVSDMSGFTKLTREHGLIHFASIIIRMRQICLPILHHYGACLVTTEADDFIAMFPTAKAAVQAADGMMRTVNKYNNDLPAEKSHFALTLNGIGVDFGEGPLMDEHNKLCGPTVSTAYSLGEDLCERGQILVSGRVKEELKEFTHATCNRVHSHDDEDVGKCADGVFELHLETQKDFQTVMVDDSQYLHADLMWLTRRNNLSLTDSDLVDMDAEIKSKFSVRRTVLMIAFESNALEDPELQMGLQHRCLALLRPILEKHQAHILEEELFLFPDPCLAVAAALEMRDAVDSDKEMFFHNGLPRAQIKGYGIHEGDILFLENTDVHWGDPVNTASKLGQDLATEGELLVSDVVFQSACRDPNLKDVKFQMRELNKSNVTFKCYLVDRNKE